MTAVATTAAPRTPRDPRAVAMLAVLVLLIGVPVATLLIGSLTPPGFVPLETAKLTVANFVELARQGDLYRLLANTLIYAAGSVVVAIAIATGMAWLTERTDFPLATLVRVLMFSWMAVPPIVVGFGWILLLNPGQGAINVLLRGVFDLGQSPLTVYSMPMMIFITGTALAPTTFVMLAGLLRNMDPQLESAATVHGAGRLTVLRKVTLPLLLPGILSIFMFLFMVAIQLFDIPLIIGLSARVPVLSTRIYLLSQPESGNIQYGLACSLGVILLVLAGLLMLLYHRATRAAERFTTVGGKGFRPRRTALGRWSKPAVALVLLYFFIMTLPVLILAWASLLPYYRTPNLAALSQLSFATYARILARPLVIRAIGNTVVMVLAAATLVMALSVIASWLAVRSRGVLAKAIDALSFAPMALPPVIIALAILLAYQRTPLYGTIWIIVLGQLTVYIAFGTRTIGAALMQIHRELENAAVVSGATWRTTVTRILLPLIRPQVINGWLWVLAHSARDLTMPLLLMTTGNVVVASALWLMWDLPDLTGAAALAMLMVVGLMIFVVPAQILAARRDR